MSNLLREFLEAGIADQILVMGQPCKLADTLNGTISPSFQAVVTSRDGQTEVELGGITYTISGQALIPDACPSQPKVGNRLETDKEVWLIVSVVKSTLDAAYSCDLVRIK